MKSGYLVEELTHDREDLESTIRKTRKIFNSRYAHLRNNLSAVDIEELRSELRDGVKKIFIAIHNGEIVASSSLLLPLDLRKPAFLSGAVVAKEHEGNGIQQELLKRRLEHIGTRKVHTEIRLASPQSTHNVTTALSQTKGGLHILTMGPYPNEPGQLSFFLDAMGNNPSLGTLSGTLLAEEAKYLKGLIPGSWKIKKNVTPHTALKVAQTEKRPGQHQMFTWLDEQSRQSTAIDEFLQKATDENLTGVAVSAPLHRAFKRRKALLEKGFIPYGISQEGKSIYYYKLLKPVKFENVNLPQSLGKYRRHLIKLKHAFVAQAKKLEKERER